MIWVQLGHAFRSLRREPGFAASAIVTLALGIAASTAIFGVFHAVLLAPLPYVDAQRAVAINTQWTDTGRLTPRLSGGDWIDVAAASDVFDAVALYHGGQVGVQLGGRAEWAFSYWVSPGFFRVFEAAPVRGRTFTDQDAEHAAVVSAGFAQRALGGLDRALGQVVRIDQRPYQVIGVMPPGFTVPAKGEVWLAGPVLPENRNRTSFNYYTVAKIKAGVTREAASAHLDALAGQLGAAHVENRHKRFAAVPLRDNGVRNVRSTLVMLLAAVGLVLLIACGNVAHLMLARAATRSREFAVRAALGASGWRIARQVLVESLSIGLAGGAAGALLAWAGVRAAVSLAPANLPRIGEARVDGSVLGFALAVSLAASVVFGMFPVWQALRTDVQESLKAAAGRGVVGSRGARLRSALVSCEIALSFTLAVGASLLARSMVELNSAALGFRTEGILVAYAHSPADTLAEARQSTRFFERALPEIARLPGVKSAAGAMGLPAGRYGSNGKYAIEGQDFTRQEVAQTLPEAGFRLASPDYFATLGIPLLAGREFTAGDQYDAQFVAIISESLARRSFPSQNPVGRKLIGGLDSDKWMTIVGVVGDVRSDGPTQVPGPELYMPFQQHPFHANELQLAVRTAGPPEATAPALVRKVRELNPDIAVQTTTLSAMVYDSVATPRFRAFLVGVFAGVALLLAMAGVYAVIAYLVAQRTGELGLRMALGCAPAGAVKLVMARAAWLAIAGLAAGVGLCAAGTRLISGMLYGVQATDAGGYAMALAAIGLVTLAAAAVPAWRASRIDPAVALREE
jgi:predicted permease